LDKTSQFVNETKSIRLIEAMKDNLDRLITPDKLMETIDKIRPHKAPGPDGLSPLYYKTFKEELTLILVIHYFIMTERKLPQSWLQATITMIHKENTDETNIKNYRPISLLNVDYKLFTNILAGKI
uniref:Reverse transcriptase domain-containing protein n=1 Tax=Anolis carolinensis TaxID=28377 RepID=A0A803TJ05_ANOCA